MPDTNVSLDHLVRQPTVPSAGKPPLLLLLHGVGSNEQDLFSLAPYLDGRFLIASVRAPLTISYGAYGWYEIQFSPTGLVHDPAGAEAGREAALKVIDELVAAYEADPDRVYLMGFSQGAIMSLGIVLSHPEKVAGAVLMSGRLLPQFTDAAVPSERLTGKPILVVHGTTDNVLPIQSGRAINEYLAATPADLTYKEYPMGHTVSEQSLSDIAAWLRKRFLD